MDLIYIVNFLVVIFIGIIIGFLSSMPIGAVQVEVAKKAINGHFMPAILIALGSATSDFIYGVLTLFGLGDFLFHKKFQIVVYIIGLIVLVFLFSRSLKEHKHGILQEKKKLVYTKRLSFLTGFTIAVTNPGMIIWWIVGYKIFLDITLFETISPVIKFVFILSGCAGLVGYLCFLATLLHRMQQSFSDRFIHRMNIFLMILLAVLIIYFAIKLVSIIFNYHMNLP